MNSKHWPADCPHTVFIQDRRQESDSIFTLDLVFPDENLQKNYQFHPGQFNMLSLFGGGEVPISISSDPAEKSHLSHTIRAVGRVTRAMQALKAGDSLGLRGPYGRGWPVEKARGKDVLVLTGGLGCAPSLSVINYMLARRADYGRIFILQGVKHSDDFIFRQQYQRWAKASAVEIHIAADVAGPQWPFDSGFITNQIQDLPLSPQHSLVMICGPEGMMHVAVKSLKEKGIAEDDIYLSMERNMSCGIGLCGHCQYGGLFICKDGPVLTYTQVKALFNEEGF